MRVGIVGVGSMGQNHARVCAELANLAGVCDADPEVGKAAADRFGTAFHPSPQDLFAEDLDAVTVAVPTHLHFDLARQALEAGLHVLLEKPFCGDAERAQALTDLADKQGLVLAAGLIERHNPCVEFAHRALRQGDYGKLITLASRRVSAFPTRVRDVGVMMDLGIHDVDVMRYLVGADVAAVYSVGGRERHDIFEDHGAALLTFANGVSGFVEANWLTPMKVRRLALTCLENYVELDYINQTVEVSSSTLLEYDPSDLYRAPFEYDVRQMALKREEPLRREIADFLRAAGGGGPPLVDGAEAVRTLRTVEAIVASHREGAPVELD